MILWSRKSQNNTRKIAQSTTGSPPSGRGSTLKHACNKWNCMNDGNLHDETACTVESCIPCPVPKSEPYGRQLNDTWNIMKPFCLPETRFLVQHTGSGLPVYACVQRTGRYELSWVKPFEQNAYMIWYRYICTCILLHARVNACIHTYTHRYWRAKRESYGKTIY